MLSCSVIGSPVSNHSVVMRTYEVDTGFAETEQLCKTKFLQIWRTEREQSKPVDKRKSSVWICSFLDRQRICDIYVFRLVRRRVDWMPSIHISPSRVRKNQEPLIYLGEEGQHSRNLHTFLPTLHDKIRVCHSLYKGKFKHR